MLSLQLEQQLSAKATQQSNFRQQLAAHNAVFEEVIKQVAVHCAERGALLDKLRKFYRLVRVRLARPVAVNLDDLWRQPLEHGVETRKVLRAVNHLAAHAAFEARPTTICKGECGVSL